MIKARTLIGLATVGVAAALAVWQLSRAPQTEDGEALFAGLYDSLNDITQIEVRANEGAFHAAQIDGQWVVRERDDYPANTRAVREFLLGVADLTIRSRKTANPELYEQLQLNDPSDANSRAVETTLRDADGAPRAALIIGRNRPSAAHPQHFVRLPDNPQTWLVEGELNAPRTPIDWLARDDFLRIDKADIRKVTLSGGGKPVNIERKTAEESLALQGVGDAMQVKDEYLVDDIINLFVSTRFDEVARADQVQVRGATATMHAFDGMRVVMRQATRDDSDNYIRLRAEVDADAEEAVREAADAHNQLWQDRAWQLAANRIDSLTQTFAELVEPVGAEEKAQ